MARCVCKMAAWNLADCANTSLESANPYPSRSPVAWDGTPVAQRRVPYRPQFIRTLCLPHPRSHGPQPGLRRVPKLRRPRSRLEKFKLRQLATGRELFLCEIEILIVLPGPVITTEISSNGKEDRSDVMEIYTYPVS
jgi:hypothetical protein